MAFQTGKTERLRFGVFEVDLAARELHKEGKRIRLQDQPFQVLTVLLQRAGQVVTREELRSQIWPQDTFVDFDNSVNTAINKLRDALGDSATNPRFIETLPRRGYRFVGPVRTGVSSSGNLQPEMEPAAARFDGPDAEGTARMHSRQWKLLAALVVMALLAGGGWLVYRSAGTKSEAVQRTLTRVTFDEGLQTEATWSPDGRYLAYSATHGGKSDVWVQQVSGGSAVQVTKGPGNHWQPEWSPDGKYIAYRSEEGDGGLYVVPALGGAGMERKVAQFGAYPRWSPDGKRILFLSIGFGVSCKVFVVDVEAGNQPREVLPEVKQRTSQIMSAVWHPDGKRVSVWGWSIEPRPLPTFWTGGVAVDSTAVQTEIPESIVKEAQLAAGNGMGSWADMDYRFSWAPSGKAIYFERSFRGAKNIWRMAVDAVTLQATAIERITTGSEGEADFALSADGHRLAFTSVIEQVREWVFPFDAVRGRLTGPGLAVTSPGAEAWEGSLSADGTKLAFQSKRAGRWELWQRSLVDGSETPIAADDTYVRNEPQWSPDGALLAYVRQKSATGELQMVTWDSKSGEEEEVTGPRGKFALVFDWSPDGKEVLASEYNEQSHQVDIWTEPVPGIQGVANTKRKRIVASEPNCDLWQGRFSPDGRWVVFQALKDKPSGYETAIYAASAGGGSWIRISEGTHWDDKPRWSPDGRTIYFLSEREGYFNVFGRRFDSAAGKANGDIFQVTQFRDPSLRVANLMATVGLSVAKDRLMVTMSQESGSIWILENVEK